MAYGNVYYHFNSRKMEKVLISVNNNLLIHEKVIELRLITDDALQFHFTWKIRKILKRWHYYFKV